MADAGALQRRWKTVVDTLVSREAAKGSLLLNGVATSDDGSRLVVTFPKGSAFAIKMLSRSDVRSVVLPVIAEVFGGREVSYVEGDTASVAAAPMPAPRTERQKLRRLVAAGMPPSPSLRPPRSRWPVWRS